MKSYFPRAGESNLKVILQPEADRRFIGGREDIDNSITVRSDSMRREKLEIIQETQLIAHFV